MKKKWGYMTIGIALVVLLVVLVLGWQVERSKADIKAKRKIETNVPSQTTNIQLNRDVKKTVAKLLVMPQETAEVYIQKMINPKAKAEVMPLAPNTFELNVSSNHDRTIRYAVTYQPGENPTVWVDIQDNAHNGEMTSLENTTQTLRQWGVEPTEDLKPVDLDNGDHFYEVKGEVGNLPVIVDFFTITNKKNEIINSISIEEYATTNE